MPNTSDTSSSGNDFDGTPSNGEVVFAGTALGQDSQRAIIYSIAVNTDGTTLTKAQAVLAADLADVQGDGPFLELAIVLDAAGFTMSCCHCVVPAGWKLFIITTEDVATDKNYFVDWSVEALIPRF